MVTILIADDEKLERNGIKLLLKREGAECEILEAENGKDKTFSSTGKRKVKHGTPSNSEAIVYELIPSDGDMAFYFQAEGDSLTLLNQELQKAASDLNYTLILVP